MGKYSRRDFQLGDWWLGQREGSPAWYAFRYDESKRRTERVSLGTDSVERAKEKLTELYLETRVVRDEKPADAPLADVLRRYWEGHAKDLRSASSNRDCINRWLDFWGTAEVAELTDIARQEAFHKFMRERGYQPTTMMRTINIGKAALNRAVARHELTSAPHLLSVRVGKRPPMGRPLSVEEAKFVYAHAVEHIQAFMRWALGTAARPEAVLELHSRQVEWDAKLVHLNPPDREQVPKKYRPIVKLPDSLSPRFVGWAVSYLGQPVASIKNGLLRACDRAGIEHCSPYSFRHTAAREMRKGGVAP